MRPRPGDSCSSILRLLEIVYGRLQLSGLIIFPLIVFSFVDLLIFWACLFGFLRLPLIELDFVHREPCSISYWVRSLSDYPSAVISPPYRDRFRFDPCMFPCRLTLKWSCQDLLRTVDGYMVPPASPPRHRRDPLLLLRMTCWILPQAHHRDSLLTILSCVFVLGLTIAHTS